MLNRHTQPSQSSTPLLSRRSVQNEGGFGFAIDSENNFPHNLLIPFAGFLPQQPFISGLQTIQADLQIVAEREDLHVGSWLEILCFYPGVQAILAHRFAHWLHHHRVAFFPRFISHLNRFFTGIEIHPGATIGKGVFISGGRGVVIGETAIVGDYTVIYQDATLGGTGKDTGKRHPTLGKHTIVGVGAKVLGNIHIGDYAEITAGAIVLKDVPPGCTVVGVPGRNICQSHTGKGESSSLFAPDSQAIRSLIDRLDAIETQVRSLQQVEGNESVMMTDPIQKAEVLTTR